MTSIACKITKVVSASTKARIRFPLIIVGLAAIIVATLNPGCAVPGASSSGVVPMGQNSYMIARTRWGYLGPEVIKAAALEEADEYCKSHGKVLLVTKTVEISIKFGSRPAAEVYFKALDPDDPELKKPHTIEEITR